MPVEAMERCAYCGRDVPVTWIRLDEGVVRSGRIAVCEGCRGDGR